VHNKLRNVKLIVLFCTLYCESSRQWFIRTEFQLTFTEGTLFCLVLSLNKLYVWNSMNHHVNILFDCKLINIADSDICFVDWWVNLLMWTFNQVSVCFLLYSSFFYQICRRLFVLCSERRHIWALFFTCVSHLATAIHVVDNTRHNYVHNTHILYLAIILTMSSIGIGTHHWYGSLPKVAKDGHTVGVSGLVVRVSDSTSKLWVRISLWGICKQP